MSTDKNTTLQIISQLALAAMDGAPAQNGGLTGLQVSGVANIQPAKPPKIKYPDYPLPPSEASYVASGEPVPKNEVSTQTEALLLGSEVGASGYPFIDNNHQANYRGDRKQWMLNIPGVDIPVNVGLALWSKNRAGIGAPGQWVKLPSSFTWKLDDADSDPWQIDPTKVQL